MLLCCVVVQPGGCEHTCLVLGIAHTDTGWFSAPCSAQSGGWWDLPLACGMVGSAVVASLMFWVATDAVGSGDNKQAAVSAGCCKCVGGMRCRGLCYATCALKCVCTAWAQPRLCVPVCVGPASPLSGLRRHSCGTVQVSRLELSVVGFGGLLHPAIVVGSPSPGMFSCALFPHHHSGASAAVQLGTRYMFHTPAVPLLLMADVVALC
jgi:hypothetical protein